MCLCECMSLCVCVCNWGASSTHFTSYSTIEFKPNCSIGRFSLSCARCDTEYRMHCPVRLFQQSIVNKIVSSGRWIFIAAYNKTRKTKNEKKKKIKIGLGTHQGWGTQCDLWSSFCVRLLPPSSQSRRHDEATKWIYEKGTRLDIDRCASAIFQVVPFFPYCFWFVSFAWKIAWKSMTISVNGSFRLRNYSSLGDCISFQGMVQ